jgi:uncharacterized protein (TIGR02466 family)
MNKKIKSTIQGIFPTPIYFSDLEKPLSKKENAFIKQHYKKTRLNEGNLSSKDNYILNNKNLSSLKKELLIKVNDYFEKIITPSDNVKPYITQSWLNFTSKNQYHHKHAHPNSIISGVLYLDVDPEKDKICFYNGEYKQISFQPKTYHPLNSNSWWFPIKNNQLILFPSSTVHSVDLKEEDNIRTSLAFNVFVKGIFGHNDNLTELILK